MYKEEYFSEEYGDFDNELFSLKNAIKKSVEEEVNNELEALRKENEKLENELAPYKNNEICLAKLEMELREKYEQKIKDFRNESFDKLLGQKLIEVYIPKKYFVHQKKCNKCNDKREILYKTPLGKEAYELCDCRESLEIYIPRKVFVDKIIIDGENKESFYCYKYNTFYDGYYGLHKEVSVKNYNDYIILDDKSVDEVVKELEEIGYYRISMFTSYEKCQKFCKEYLENNKDVIDENDYNHAKNLINNKDDMGK